MIINNSLSAKLYEILIFFYINVNIMVLPFYVEHKLAPDFHYAMEKVKTFKPKKVMQQW